MPDAEPEPESRAAHAPPNAVGAFYEIARWRLDEQLHRVDTLNSRVSNMFYLIAALVPLFGAVFAFTETQGPALVLYGVGVGVFFLVVALTVLAYLGSKWSLRPDLGPLREYADTYDQRTVRRWIAIEMMRSVGENEPRLARKQFFVSAATVAFALDAALLVGAAIVATLA